tara:strand:+ start:716 stop:997 length:282 start_codon:yes stop_codon:yes gene_type:complete
MRKFEIEDAVIKIKWDLRRLGLDFPVEVIGDVSDGDTAVVVQYGEGILGQKIETLDKYFNHDLFMMFFKGRLNFKLTDEESINTWIHVYKGGL